MLNDADFLAANTHITDAEIVEDMRECNTLLNRMTQARAVSLNVAPRLAVGYATKIQEAKDWLAVMERLARLRKEKANAQK